MDESPASHSAQLNAQTAVVCFPQCILLSANKQKELPSDFIHCWNPLRT